MNTYLTGVQLAINAIADAYLVVDGPNCAIFRCSQIQGNHDWHSTLLSADGQHRVADTDATPDRIAAGDDRLLRERLKRIADLPACGVLLLVAMSPVAVTGRQHDRILADLGLGDRVIHIPSGSLDGDHLDGYARTLASLAAGLPLAASGPEPAKVAMVGHLHDRNEADRHADAAQIRHLLEGCGLELISCWLDGSGAASLCRISEAGLIVSLPYAREAARILAGRTGAELVECGLPIGLEGTSRFIREIAKCTGREAQAEAFISSELDRIVPRLEWVLLHRLQGKRLAVIADCHLACALAEACQELGCRVLLRCDWSSPSHIEPREHTGPGTRVEGFDPGLGGVLAGLASEGLDLLLTNAHALITAGLPGGVAEVEIGFPSYHHHALFERPLLGYDGAAGLAERLINALAAEAVRQGQRGAGALDTSD
ncbi:MAG: hypothetical protein JXR96_29585 [Deltaproteobacteria bacterium]|nr:hypothetical protein [Deltaproteobacteria bacterium]